MDKKLDTFQILNSGLNIIKEEGGVEIRNLWGLPELYFSVKEPNNSFYDAIENIVIDPRYDAIIHNDRDEIEFIYAFLDPKNEIVVSYFNRKFEFCHDSQKYYCRYDKPSKELMVISKYFRRLPSESSRDRVSQMEPFRDYHRKDKLNPSIQKYFNSREPRNFFVSGISKAKDLSSLFKHINIVVTYYDREAPRINIRDIESPKTEGIIKRARYVIDKFPDTLAARNIDEVLLTLLEVASISGPRSAYLYYYQVLEYAGYYYIGDKIKGKLKNMLRDPSIINCDDDKISDLFDLLISNHHADDVKIQKVMDECVNLKNVWVDVSNDIDFFSSKIEFDGGYISEPIITKDITPDTWSAIGMPKLYTALTNIRNVIVHARERRENKVIWPTQSNTNKLRRYIPIIRRIAEEVAIKCF